MSTVLLGFWSTVFLIVGLRLTFVHADQWIFREKAHQRGFATPPKGKLASQNEIHTVTFIVDRRNLNLLEENLLKVSTPGSPQYGQYLSKEEVGRLIQNPVATNAVVNFLKKKGANINSISEHADWITASAPLRLWAEIFHTHFYEYHHDEWHGKIFRAKEYHLPFELHEHVSTVLDVTHFPVKPHSTTPFVKTTDISGTSATERYRGIHGYVYPRFAKDYYGLYNQTAAPSTTIMIFQAGGQLFDPEDLHDFQTEFRLVHRPLKEAIGGGITPDSCADLRDCIGVTTNIETTSALGEDSAVILSRWVNSDYLTFLKNVTHMTNRPDVISFSGYVSYESSFAPTYLDEFNILAMELGLQGTTLIAPSGNDGVAGGNSKDDSANCGYFPQFPASSPFVTTVGATEGPETAFTERAAVSAVSSGGGFSNHYRQPAYQRSYVDNYFSNASSFVEHGYPKAGYNRSGRAYPDVSALSNSFLVVWDKAVHTVSSVENAVSVFAGITTVLNTIRMANGLPTMGFLNPFLYAYGNGILRDIDIGSNFCTSVTYATTSVYATTCQEGFYATTGWDPVTGIGSPLFQSMAAEALKYTPMPTTAPTETPSEIPTVTPTEIPSAYPTEAPAPFTP